MSVAIARLPGSRGPGALAEIRDAAGTQLDVGNGWCVGAVYLRTRLGREAGVNEIAARHRLPGPVLRPAFEQARADGYLTGDEDHLRLTAAGQRQIDGRTAAMRAWLAGQLQDWGAEDDQLLCEAMGNIAREIVDEDPVRTPTPELATVAAR